MNHEHELYRILDAAANRAREGLRVIEDYTRFVLNDQFFTEQLKQVRHELAHATKFLPSAALLAQRDTLHDVGTSLSTPSEDQRQDAAAVLMANWKRLQEALRSLEEFSKPLPSSPANLIEALRYRCYTLERALMVNQSAKQKLEHARLYLLLDCRKSEQDFHHLAAKLVAAPIDVIQLRDKQADDRTLLERGLLLRKLLRDQTRHHDRAPLLIINDRPDLAVLCEADGVHVGQEELPVAAVRRVVGSNMMIGVSTHSLVQAKQAVLDGADYIGVGPTFPSQTKSFADFPGLGLLREVASKLTLPAFAIGGIDSDNLQRVLETGIKRIAVGSAILAASDPITMCHELADALIDTKAKSVDHFRWQNQLGTRHICQRGY
jgi:thiamine-phosphate pyrophosphorylase